MRRVRCRPRTSWGSCRFERLVPEYKSIPSPKSGTTVIDQQSPKEKEEFGVEEELLEGPLEETELPNYSVINNHQTKLDR